MRKGVSAIIATILLLMITIALAGTAYVYINRMITAQTDKVIQITSFTCSADGKNLILVLNNIGSRNITITNDLTWIVDNAGSMEFGVFTSTANEKVIGVFETVAFNKTGNYKNNVVTVTISASNSETRTIYC